MNLLVTAGPTREYIDTVRFVSNPSSGKMGYAVAVEAAGRGHHVTLIAGPVALADPPNMEITHVVSARQMLDAVLSRFEQCHAVVMTAAVGDYRPVTCLDRKLPKQNQPRLLELQPTEDILAYLGQRRAHQALIGFAMEDHEPHARAEDKLRRKRCDAIVLTGMGNVGSDTGTIEILDRVAGWSGPVSGAKSKLARVVVDLAENWVSMGSTGVPIGQ